MHRLIMEHHIGRKLKSNEHIHHINNNKLDNRIENLQIVSPSEHIRIHLKSMNLKRPNPNKIGVSYNKKSKKYYPHIMKNYKSINLGSYKTFDEARAKRLWAVDNFDSL